MYEFNELDILVLHVSKFIVHVQPAEIAHMRSTRERELQLAGGAVEGRSDLLVNSVGLYPGFRY